MDQGPRVVSRENRGSSARSAAPQKARRRDVAVALACGAFVGLMVGAAYAAVPLYNWFCQVTG
ncbi:MAG: cytochrome c oxidase assembly protein, partial [Rhodoplanes sp.]